MRQHARNDAVSPPAMLGDLFEIARQHRDDFIYLRARIVAERRDSRRGRLLQLVQELDREPGEVVDEIKRVLDLVRDPGGQLTERVHLLGMDQTGLSRL